MLAELSPTSTHPPFQPRSIQIRRSTLEAWLISAKSTIWTSGHRNDVRGDAWPAMNKAMAPSDYGRIAAALIIAVSLFKYRSPRSRAPM